MHRGVGGAQLKHVRRFAHGQAAGDDGAPAVMRSLKDVTVS